MILASVLTTNIAILVLAGFVGFIVISKIPNTLHTPLMSGTNAIHGVVLVGALLLLGFANLGALSEALLVIAVTFGTINIVGGFLVTDRMLDMFKAKKPSAGARASARAPEGAASSAADAASAGSAASPAVAAAGERSGSHADQEEAAPRLSGAEPGADGRGTGA